MFERSANIASGDIFQAYKFYGKMHFAEAIRQCQKDGTFVAMAKNKSDSDDLKIMLETAGVNESRVFHDCVKTFCSLLCHFPFTVDGHVWAGLLTQRMHALIGGGASSTVWMDGTALNGSAPGSGPCYHVRPKSHSLHEANCDFLNNNQDEGPFAICEYDPCHPAIKSGGDLIRCYSIICLNFFCKLVISIGELRIFSDPNCAPPEEYMFFPKTGKYYKPHFKQVGMIEALQTCQAEGAHLAEYRSEAEYEAVVAMHSKLD